MTYRNVGVLYHPRQPEALSLAQTLRDTVLAAVPGCWMAETGDEEAVSRHMAETDLLICIGGDGTVLWAARAAVPHPVPIVSINKGQLGFLSELSPIEAATSIQEILDGSGTIEERAMVECTMPPLAGYPDGPASGLNDMVVGRAAPGRPVYLSISVDGEHLARVRADGIIVATATGSTAYNLSAGGPVLMPLSRQLLLTPVAPHLSRMRTVVLPPEAMVAIQVETDHQAIISVDGQLDRPLSSGCVVEARISKHVARFVRFGPPSEFFHKLAEHLNLSTRRE